MNNELERTWKGLVTSGTVPVLDGDDEESQENPVSE